ncbi:MAG: ABC transporter permease, partial [Pseudomonadota bacterium]
MEAFEALLVTIIAASTPLLLAAVGELVVERSGVLNLGVEGMMIIGAVCAFASAYSTGSAWIGVFAGMGAGMVFSLAFAFLTQKLLANQVASGLALTLLGLGISGQIGDGFTGLPGVKLQPLLVPFLHDIPVVGPILFSHDPLVYLSFVITAAVAWVLFKTRTGLIIRAVGDNHDSAHMLGYKVVQTRTCCIAFGGACAGLAGCYLSLVYTPQWIENMGAGRGWIALALVVFATWLPGR